MAIQKIKNALIYCLAADTKPATYADNTLAYEVDTGSVYKSTSGVWSIISGASKTETLTNKTMNANNNSIDGFVPYARYKRMSYSYQSTTGFGMIGWMGGLNVVGTATRVNDANGLHSDYATGASANSRAGRAANSAEVTVARASNTPALYCKFAAGTATTTTLYIGFSTATTIPTTDTPLANADSGVILGWSSVDTNFQVFNNDGGGAAIKTAYSPTTAVDTAVHSCSLIWSSPTSVKVTLDALAPVTLTTRLPASTALMIPYGCLTNTTAVSRTISLYYFDGDQSP